MALAGEVARRLLNTSPELVEEGVAEGIIEEFEYKMCLSGYNQIERELILREGRARYDNIILKSQRGDRPIYRSAEWNKEGRSMSKLRSRNGWYGPEMHSVLLPSSAQFQLSEVEAEMVFIVAISTQQPTRPTTRESIKMALDN